MRICLPVICQNGHKAMSHFRFDRQSMEFVWEGVTREESCKCPKHDVGQGWRANGDPFIQAALALPQERNGAG